MNKKFSTLVAGFLAAGMIPVGAMAQHHTNNGEVPYRTDMVKSAVSSYHCNGVKAIDGGLWYQLVVEEATGTDSDASSPTAKIGANTKVLTMERNYMTGELTLKAVKFEEAALTHSLWRITTIKDNVNSQVLFAFENKETGYKLTFDENVALDLNGEAEIGVGTLQILRKQILFKKVFSLISMRRTL